MSLNIKNAETHRLVKELAERTGTSMTAAVTEAVREQLERIRGETSDAQLDVERGLDLLAEMRSRFAAGYLDRDFDAEMYDERGLPR